MRLAPAALLAAALALLLSLPGVAGAQSCGECHAVPPPSGRHAKHARKGVACTACHGAQAGGPPGAGTHGDGVVQLLPALGYDGAGCAASCHRARAWSGGEHGEHHGEREHGERHGDHHD